ncbi:MAG TPA: nucleotide exchange factor GrpE [Dehalococcoidales bacterium]|nr:nucleotide exchange factor GrpE [Dehalococcoidales bacterium]
MMLFESEEKPNIDAVPEVTETEDLEKLKQALAEEKAKAEANLAGWQRAQADFMNFKRRSEQEREEYTHFANANLILEFLPVLDDLERALEHTPVKLARMAWVDGVNLIYRKFRATLEAQGLTQIEALGKPFDPNLHEAVRQDKGIEGIVIEEIRKGYQLHDKVIRPTMVVVGNGEDTEKEDE